MRAFIAIEIPEGILRILAAEQARLRPAVKDARWTRPEGIHLTLKFLGEISEPKSQAVIHALRSIGSFEPFSIEIAGFGFFPSARRPRVFWAGVSGPPALAQLAARVDSALEPLGFPGESRAFTAHLTLARFDVAKPRPGLEAQVRESSSVTFGSFTVFDFHLWESRLSSAGSAYQKVATIGGSPDGRSASQT